MRKIVLIIIGMLAVNFVHAQQFTYRCEKLVKTPLLRHYTMSTENESWVELVNTIYPEHHDRISAAKIQRNSERFDTPTFKNFKNKYISDAAGITPDTTKTFNGLPVGSAGIPNDNNMAISNDGMVVSVVNSSLSIFQSSGNFIRYKTLRTLVGSALPNLDRTYDPKVLYDPIEDRFILVFLQGSTSNDTRIIVGFTKTNNPDGEWNFYAIDGNPFLGKTWSDYPIIAINQKDLFITVNILKDDESWQEGFTQSVIWQISKSNGYAGDTLIKNVFHDIKYNGEPIWSICPVSPTVETSDYGLYLLSVRPSALANDTVFIHRLNGDVLSGNTTYTLHIAKSDLEYGVPPSAFQPGAGFRLQTNDTRVLSGFYHKSHIQYVQSSYIPTNKKSGIYHGTIQNLQLPSLIIHANYITHDTFDMAYPSITSVADSRNEFASAVTGSYSSSYHYPGTLAFYHNKARDLPSIYSNPVVVRRGNGLINTFLADSIERWGDYTAIQIKYNDREKVWMSGSYGMANSRNGVWIGEIRVSNNLEIEVINEGISIYPVPGNGYFSARLNNQETGNIQFECVTLDGKVIMEETFEKMNEGEFEWFFDISGLSSGIYIVRATMGNGKDRYVKKVILD